MTPAFSARRRADDFEALVSRSDHTPLTERDARDFAALLAVVEDLRAVPEVTARPEFVGDLPFFWFVWAGGCGGTAARVGWAGVVGGAPPGVRGWGAFVMGGPASGVVADRAGGRAGRRPDEADAVLVVDTNRVLSVAVASQLLEPVARRDAQVVDCLGGVE